MSYISLSQAFEQWQELAADIPKDDGPALAESWNEYTDSLCKDGKLCALQYHYAPSYDEPMPGDGSRFDPLSDDRAFILEAMGVTMSAVFVPFSQSRNKAEKRPSLNWRVTLKKDGRDVIETDYMQGSGHTPAYNNPATFPNGKRDQYTTDTRIREECETGRYSTGRRLPLPAPDVADVLYSLMLDASALDCRDFAEWASGLGMDTDSIKARDIYNTCLADALKMRAAFGDKTMRELAELFEGM